MDFKQIRDALVAGGVPPQQLDADRSDAPTHYSAILDPAAAEPLMILLAEALRPYRPNRIVVWEGVENSILAYTVARHLGVPATRIVDASGILDYDGELRRGDRVAMVADAFRADLELVATKRLIDGRGGQVVAAAALISTPFLAALGGAVPTEALWQPDGTKQR